MNGQDPSRMTLIEPDLSVQTDQGSMQSDTAAPQGPR